MVIRARPLTRCVSIVFGLCDQSPYDDGARQTKRVRATVRDTNGASHNNKKLSRCETDTCRVGQLK